MPEVTEDFPDEWADELADESVGVVERTGVPAVDRVLAVVESVGELPLVERVQVFEHAHDELRRALDAHPSADVARR